MRNGTNMNKGFYIRLFEIENTVTTPSGPTFRHNNPIPFAMVIANSTLSLPSHNENGAFSQKASQKTFSNSSFSLRLTHPSVLIYPQNSSTPYKFQPRGRYCDPLQSKIPVTFPLLSVKILREP